MKFLLNEEKFILNESSKFILEERFNLEEEILLEAQATLKQLVIDLNKLNTLLPDLLAVLPTGISLKILDGTALEGEKLDIETEIQTKCTEIQDLLKTKKNFKELIDQIRAKAELSEGSFTDEEVKILQPLCYNIASDGNSVKDRLKGIKGHKGELAEQVATLQERLPKLKTGLENLYKFFETPDSTDPGEEPSSETIEYSLKTDRVKLKVGDTFQLKVLATPKPKEAVKVEFASADTSIATISEIGLISAVKEGSTQITATVADKVLTCAVISLPAADVNWEELYKACGENSNRKEAYNAFWNGGLPKKGQENPKGLPLASTDKMAAGYYQGEWGKHAGLIKSLGTLFTDSLTEFGWTATLNPFIALLKHLCKFNKVLINDSSFSQLHSMYKNEITEADLRGEGKLKELNLIRNPLFYDKSTTEIADYLSWQHAALQGESQLPSDSKLEVIYANIVSSEGDLSDLKNKATYSAISSANFQYPIRQLTKYKELIKKGFKVDGDKTKVVQATDEDVTNILSKITTEEKAKKFLAYLVNRYRVANLALLTKLLAEPFGDKVKTNRNATSTTFEEDRDFDNLINTAAKKYSFNQLKTLITKLLETAKLN